MTTSTDAAAGGDGRIEVLLVDDSPDLVDTAAELIERAHPDISVDTATSAPDAFTVLRERRVDCVVSDYQMPSVDGIEFLRAVREAFPDLAFILFTNKGSDQVADLATESGVTDYVQKGVAPEQYDRLAACIREASSGPDSAD